MIVVNKIAFVFLIFPIAFGVKSQKKRDPKDYNDADLQRLWEQWEKDEEPLPLDELPEWDPRRPQPQIDLNDLSAFKSPEDFVRASKKGKSTMLFAKVSGNPTREETEELSSIWQTGLWNSHIQSERFMLEDDRPIYLFKDGSMAWEAKDYLIQQERCEEVSLEQKTYHGLHTPKGREEAEKESQKAEEERRKRKDKRDQKLLKDQELKNKKAKEKLRRTSRKNEL